MQETVVKTDLKKVAKTFSCKIVKTGLPKKKGADTVVKTDVKTAVKTAVKTDVETVVKIVVKIVVKTDTRPLCFDSSGGTTTADTVRKERGSTGDGVS